MEVCHNIHVPVIVYDGKSDMIPCPVYPVIQRLQITDFGLTANTVYYYIITEIYH